MVNAITPVANPQAQSPAIITSPQGSEAAVLQALMSGVNPQSQAAAQQQLAIMAKRQGNKRYVLTCLEKHAPALTNGSSTQSYALNSPLTFNLPQPNNAFVKGVIVRTTLAYTNNLAGGTFANTAAGAMALFDTIEVRYNKSQIKIPPVLLQHLAMMGALDQDVWPEQVVAGASNQLDRYQDATVQAFTGPASMPVTTGAQTYQFQFYLPFNLLSRDEDRGLLPSMPGTTGIQVICNTPSGIYGPDPRQNAIYQATGSGGSITAISGTVMVEAVYHDGEVYGQQAPLPYDMSVLNGTIQMQAMSQLINLQAGSTVINRWSPNVQGLHAYIILLVIDGQQSNTYASWNNITYLDVSKDGIGANTFWKYGNQTFLSLNDWLAMQRDIHRGDLVPGVLPIVQAPLDRQTSERRRDGKGYLDNTSSGWPAWSVGISLTTVANANGINSRIEAYTVFVNPIGLMPVG